MLEQLIQSETRMLEAHRPPPIIDPTFLPIHIVGGIGDVIIAIDAIRELAKKYLVVVYTKHVEAFKYFYPDTIPVFKIAPEYTWKLEFNTLAKFVTTGNFSGFLIPDHKELFDCQQKAFGKCEKLRSLIDAFSEKYFLIANYGKQRGISRREMPMHSLGLGHKLPFFSLERQPTQDYITIHDGFDVQHKDLVIDRATKQWSKGHWEKLCFLIKKEFPELRIVQLGAETSKQIQGVDECLINKTTITEAFNILKYSKLHIDGDSGLVHAATRLQTPCVVLWGSTPHYFYGYPQNINLTSNVCPDACYGLTDRWHDTCPIGYSTPKCIDEITPETVMVEIKRAFGATQKP